jgi:hypothetical protein
MEELLASVPDLIGEVPGWRAWNVIGEHTSTPRVASPHTVGDFDGIWPTNRWMVAACPFGHPVAEIPTEQCGCGLYAANSIEELLRMHYGALSQGLEHCKVIGEIGFAGRVIRGTNASRGQRARVVRLYVPFSKGELGEALSRVYDVPWEFGPWWALLPGLR